MYTMVGIGRDSQLCTTRQETEMSGHTMNMALSLKPNSLGIIMRRYYQTPFKG